MKIFLSWSGKRSCAVAEALNEQLPRIIQAVEPFFFKTANVANDVAVFGDISLFV